MLKIKLLVGLAGTMAVMAAMAVAAVPAMAEFETTTNQSQGKIGTFPKTTTFESVEGGPAVACKSTNAEGQVVAAGGWTIQVKTLTQQGKFFYQALALRGPHEQLKIIKWGVCTGPTGVAAAVECNLQVESNGTSPGATGSVYPPGCVVKLGTPENFCAITVQPDGNKELQGTKLKNGTFGVEIETNTKGVTSTVQENKILCKTLGIKGGQGTGKYFTTGAIETEGQKLV